MHALLAAALLLFSGGAVPGATFGGTGVQGASVNYVALPSWGGATIQVIKRDTGEVDRWRNFRRPYGIPVAAYDGSSTTGLSRDERRPPRPDDLQRRRWRCGDGSSATHVSLVSGAPERILAPCGPATMIVRRR